MNTVLAHSNASATHGQVTNNSSQPSQPRQPGATASSRSLVDRTEAAIGGTAGQENDKENGPPHSRPKAEATKPGIKPAESGTAAALLSPSGNGSSKKASLNPTVRDNAGSKSKAMAKTSKRISTLSRERSTKTRPPSLASRSINVTSSNRTHGAGGNGESPAEASRSNIPLQGADAPVVLADERKTFNDGVIGYLITSTGMDGCPPSLTKEGRLLLFSKLEQLTTELTYLSPTSDDYYDKSKAIIGIFEGSVATGALTDIVCAQKLSRIIEDQMGSAVLGSGRSELIKGWCDALTLLVAGIHSLEGEHKMVIIKAFKMPVKLLVQRHEMYLKSGTTCTREAVVDLCKNISTLLVYEPFSDALAAICEMALRAPLSSKYILMSAGEILTTAFDFAHPKVLFRVDRESNARKDQSMMVTRATLHITQASKLEPRDYGRMALLRLMKRNDVARIKNRALKRLKKDGRAHKNFWNASAVIREKYTLSNEEWLQKAGSAYV